MTQQITINSSRLGDAGLASFVAGLSPTPPGQIDPLVWTGGEAGELAIALYKERIRSYGRDPNRYRISSDALRRRSLREPIPSIHPLVDTGNALSLTTGWPVGCYDPEAISGDVVLRLGHEGETVETLGKGLFAVGNLPVLVDSIGAFGSPVSDSVRTRIQTHLGVARYFLYFYGPLEPESISQVIEAVIQKSGLTLLNPVAVVR